jgi:hypothetical protein
VPLPNPPAASDEPAGFADRYGKWASQPRGVLGRISSSANTSPAPNGQRSESPNDETLVMSETPDDAMPVRRLSSSVPVSAPSLAPAASPPLRGISSGRPMRDDVMRADVFEPKSPSLLDDDELYQRWMRMIDR